MSDHWFWLDLEMTGLDPQTDRIIEAAAIVTRVQPATGAAAQSAGTTQLQAVAQSQAAAELEAVAEFESTVFQPQAVLDTMDEWNRKTHGESGLTARVPQGITEAALDIALCELADRYWAAAGDQMGQNDKEPATQASQVILCGNSIGQDRKFVDRYLPQFAARLHYRMLDVSSFKIVYQQLYNRSFKKQNTHRALDDIRESIAELQFYLGN